ncbi:MAG TPA: hypothetical protein VFM70_04560 [Salinimicrobium sp.]|nr:hypothetical protein [Salinimicrobium sp.]
MDEDHDYTIRRQLNLHIPAGILSHKGLSLNEKYVLGLDYALSSKLGSNKYLNKQISQMLQLHVNIISYTRKSLVQKGFLEKNGRHYRLSEKAQKIRVENYKYVLLPYQVYHHNKLCTGAKLLWGVYNSISKGYNEYFAKRTTTASNLGVSVESVSKWTAQLHSSGFLNEYRHNTGYSTNQTIVVTRSFVNGASDSKSKTVDSYTKSGLNFLSVNLQEVEKENLRFQIDIL